MKRWTAKTDAFGQALWQQHRGGKVVAMVERSDGLVEPLEMGIYFTPSSRWSALERQALRLARGRVLDIGCGAGRHSLYLQRKRHDVTGIDSSPLAIRVCRERGLRKARTMFASELSPRLGTFDTALMFGNNFGLSGSFAATRRLFKRLHAMTSDGARVLAQAHDPYGTKRPEHLRYHRANRRRGRMSGQIRIRVRHWTWATPWFDWLLVSRDEMRAILAGTGWHVARTLERGSSMYVAVIEKDTQSSAATR